MKEFLHQFWLVCGQLAPWLFFGSAMAALLHILIPRSFFRKHLKPGASGIIKAALLGVPMPLCSCGVIPAAIGLRKQGASKSASLSFLISTPQTGLDSILVSASMLSWPFAIFKLISAFITGIIGGFILLPSEKNEHLENSNEPKEAEEKIPFSWGELWNFAFYELFHSIWKWLLIGIFISAIINTFVPQDFFVNYLPENDFLAALFMLVISLPLYVCATSSVPVAAALIGKGLPLGAAIVFLMAGPASNAATIGAIYRAFGKRFVMVYLSVVGLGSLLFAQIFGFVLPNASSAIPHMHEHANLLTELSAGLLIIFFCYCFYLDRKKPIKGEVAIFKVEGLTCQGCVNNLRTKLRDHNIAEDVSAEISTKVCTFSGIHCSPEEVLEKVQNLGYIVEKYSPPTTGKSCCSKKNC